MAFITKEDLGSAMYGYQIDEITEGDDTLVARAINTAIQEVKSYLYSATTYNVPLIFAATGAQRVDILVTHCATIAKWYIVELCNADIIQETAEKRYKEAIAWLYKLSSGKVVLDDLPTIPIEETQEEMDNLGYGSRLKFNHDI